MLEWYWIYRRFAGASCSPLTTDKQEAMFDNLEVEVIQIPEYYYDED